MLDNSAAKFSFSDFTEDNYRSLLETAHRRAPFRPFGNESGEPHILWRHDVDVSPHRALRLAQIENEMQLRATYFFLFHGPFYNCLEPEIRDIIRNIAGLGHDIGLHFDVSFYEDIIDVASLERRIAAEALLLEDVSRKDVGAVSFHNPTEQQLAAYAQPRLAGLANAYAQPVRERYKYVSDSNGYWRFHSLRQVLEDMSDSHIHVLTHPEWWTPDILSPRSRIARAVEGRAHRILSEYDAFLDSQGRLNVR